jgi:hypothetical protein
MEIRERIEEAKSAGELSGFDALRETVAARRDTTLSEIGSLCANLEIAPDETRLEIRKLINSMKYFDNLLSDLAGDPLAKSAIVGAV